ncbi:MAG TPA: hypothetical protein VFU47_15110 [Armatimonadota bacterium]|nr:hypothetical protein [Armatimonadota bacterium]
MRHDGWWLMAAGLAVAAGPVLGAVLKSGPQVGQRPLPFTSNFVTGQQRGKQYCYVCELKDEPAVLVFARKTDEPTARLLRGVRDAVRDNAGQKLFGWFVFLGQPGTANETALERAAYQFARQNGATSLPISALGDPAGPPGYEIDPDAELTLVFFRSKKVLANRSYRAKEWNARAADALVRELPKLLRNGAE